ncbi:MAG: hypothetical protein AAF581_09195 [Planctomycetota bacterium]
MYSMMDAHPSTVIVVVGTTLVTPLYLLATFVFSGASARKGLLVAVAALVFATVQFWVCLSDLPGRLGLPGNAVVPAAWILPTILLLLFRRWVLSDPLSQRWLVGLQLFRAIGAVFLVEMARGNLPGVFAYPAGVGDVAVACIALAVLLRYRGQRIPRGAVLLVVLAGLADFISAFFFGFTSSETPLQLFFPVIPNDVTSFPTGMIPLFLVPYAIFFHFLSWWNYLLHEKKPHA